MQDEARSTLSDLKAKREMRGPVSRFTGCRWAYGFKILCAIGLAMNGFRLSTRGEELLVSAAANVIIATAGKDSHRAARRPKP
ncbi:MAG TPA: hypothetical protein VN775_10630 [Opitutaceae bacterium]|nr:hypothetical protein [Opitutaceae bacterium]